MRWLKNTKDNSTMSKNIKKEDINSPENIKKRNDAWSAYYKKHTSRILPKLYAENAKAKKQGVLNILQHQNDEGVCFLPIQTNLGAFLKEEGFSENSYATAEEYLSLDVSSSTDKGNISVRKASQILSILDKPLTDNIEAKFGGVFSYRITLEVSVKKIITEYAETDIYKNLVNPSFILPALREIARLPWTKLSFRTKHDRSSKRKPAEVCLGNDLEIKYATTEGFEDHNSGCG
jgi:hypothetical protein